MIDIFSVLSGEVNLVFKIMEFGGNGCISATANVVPKLYVELYEAANEGEYERANCIQDRINHLVNEVFRVTNPIPLAHMFGTNLRLPLCREDNIQEEIDTVLGLYSTNELGIDISRYI